MLQGFQLEKDPGIHIERIVFKRYAWSAPDVPRNAPGGVLDLHARKQICWVNACNRSRHLRRLLSPL
jgi:hypothetical protein